MELSSEVGFHGFGWAKMHREIWHHATELFLVYLWMWLVKFMLHYIAFALSPKCGSNDFHMTSYHADPFCRKTNPSGHKPAAHLSWFPCHVAGSCVDLIASASGEFLLFAPWAAKDDVPVLAMKLLMINGSAVVEVLYQNGGFSASFGISPISPLAFPFQARTCETCDFLEVQ